MELAELLRRVAGAFEAFRIPYLVTGSMATVAYGEPRFTRDIAGVVQVMGAELDREYVETWARRLCLESLWHQVVERATKETQLVPPESYDLPTTGLQPIRSSCQVVISGTPSIEAPISLFFLKDPAYS